MQLNRIYSVTDLRNVEIPIGEALAHGFAQTWLVVTPEGDRVFIESEKLWSLGVAVMAATASELRGAK